MWYIVDERVSAYEWVLLFFGSLEWFVSLVWSYAAELYLSERLSAFTWFLSLVASGLELSYTAELYLVAAEG